MTPTEQKHGDSETTSWLQTFYQIAHSDTRWAKEQGWRVVNWALLLFDALLVVQQYLSANVSPLVFAAIDAGVLLVAIFYLFDLQSWASSTRRTAEKIENKIPEVSTVLERRAYDKDNKFFMGVQFIVIFVAFFLVLMAHLCWCQKVTVPNKCVEMTSDLAGVNFPATHEGGRV